MIDESPISHVTALKREWQRRVATLAVQKYSKAIDVNFVVRPIPTFIIGGNQRLLNLNQEKRSLTRFSSLLVRLLFFDWYYFLPISQITVVSMIVPPIIKQIIK